MLVWLCIRAIVVVCGRCVTASSVICVVASVHRQPFVPLHRATALCGCLYASLHNGFVWLSLCILAYRLFATTCKHPCLKPLGVHFRHPCLFMNALLALRPCKAFGRSFQASLPCLPLPLHQPPTLPQALQTACQALKIIPAFNGFCALQYHTRSNQLIRKNRFFKKATAKAVAQKIIYLKPF